MSQQQYPSMYEPSSAPPLAQEYAPQAYAPQPNIMAYAQPVSHRRSAPATQPYDKMKQRKVMLMVTLAVAIVLIIFIMFTMFSPKALRHSLARCGWVMYSRVGCGYCTKQKELLGGHYGKTIECDTCGNQVGGYTSTPPIPCKSPMIKGFPFWYNVRTQQTRTGLQDIASMEKMAQW